MCYQRPSFRLFRLNWQRPLLLVLGLVLAWRALAWPLDMAVQRPASAESATVAQLDGEACHARHAAHDQHDGYAHPEAAASGNVAAAVQAANPADGAAGKTDAARVCQIFCAVACAPLLLPAQALPAAIAVQSRYAPPLPLPLGVVAPPDLPPPIA